MKYLIEYQTIKGETMSFFIHSEREKNSAVARMVKREEYDWITVTPFTSRGEQGITDTVYRRT